jgi:hypothetical protein
MIGSMGRDVFLLLNNARNRRCMVAICFQSHPQKTIFNRIAKLIQDIAEARVQINSSINGGNFLNKVQTG